MPFTIQSLTGGKLKCCDMIMMSVIYLRQGRTVGRDFDWTSRLREYHENKVKLKAAETKTYIELLMPTVEDILKYVNKEDPRFNREPGKVGSFWQKLKVTAKADEFDFNVHLDYLGVWAWVDEVPRYYGFSRPVSPDSDTVPDDLDVVQTAAPLTPSKAGHPAGRLRCGNILSDSVSPHSHPLLTVTPGVPLPPVPIGYTFVTRGRGYKPIWETPNDLVRCGDIVPFLVKRQLKRLVTQAVRDLALRGMFL